jgi:iron complex outermembrane receptor protein
LQASYSRLDIDLNIKPGSSDSAATISTRGSAPRHMAQMHSRHDIGHRLELDAAVYYVGQLAAVPSTAGNTVIPAYTRLDLRLGWRPRRGVEMSLAAQNLLDDRHPEYLAQDVVASQVPRSLQAMVKLWF